MCVGIGGWAVGRLSYGFAVIAVALAVALPAWDAAGDGGPVPADASALARAEIPPGMLTLYRAGAAWATQRLACPLRWQLLAAIGMTETGHAHSRSPRGEWVALTRRQMTSPAGALGPMQFLPSSWASRDGGGAEQAAVVPGTAVADTGGWDGHGVDAPIAADGVADVWDPADSVFGAAHYLCASGARDGDERAALFAYNHSDAYVVTVLTRAERYTAPPSHPVTAHTTDSILCPVGGHVSFTPSFGAPRSGGRSHKGNDLMAEEGTPTLAVENGTVERTSDTDVGLGGIVVWLRGESGASYYYAHHSRNFVSPGARVGAGDAVGLVGHTGNAASTPPHLHFEIHPAGRGAAAVDPYEVLVDACAEVRR